MSEPYIGEIRAFPYDYAPQGWADCNGQQLPIQRNASLYAVIGTSFGGDGTTNFKVPDLRGQAAMGTGDGPGLSPRRIGDATGSTSVKLDLSQLPSHTHVQSGEVSQEAFTDPTGKFPGASKKVGTTTVTYYKGQATADASFAADAIGSVGGGEVHENRQPSLVLRYCIALEGVFPTRA